MVNEKEKGKEGEEEEEKQCANSLRELKTMSVFRFLLLHPPHFLLPPIRTAVQSTLLLEEHSLLSYLT